METNFKLLKTNACRAKSELCPSIVCTLEYMTCVYFGCSFLARMQTLVQLKKHFPFKSSMRVIYLKRTFQGERFMINETHPRLHSTSWGPFLSFCSHFPHLFLSLFAPHNIFYCLQKKTCLSARTIDTLRSFIFVTFDLEKLLSASVKKYKQTSDK